MKATLICLLLFCSGALAAQSKPCSEYDQILQKLETSYRNGAGNLDECLHLVDALRACDPAREAVAVDWTHKIFNAIKAQKAAADASAREAIRARQQADASAKVAEKAVLRAHMSAQLSLDAQKLADLSAQEANYNLAKFFEEKAATALEKHHYAEAWLYNQEALKRAVSCRQKLPITMGRLFLQEMCPCPNQPLPLPFKARGRIAAITYDSMGTLLALEKNIVFGRAGDNDKGGNETHLALLSALDGSNTFSRKEYGGGLTNLLSQSFSVNGSFVTLHKKEQGTEIMAWEVGPDSLYLVPDWINGYLNTVTCLAYSPAGKQLACGLKGGNVVVWEKSMVRPKPFFKSNPVEISDLAYSPDGSRFAYGYQNGQVVIVPLDGSGTRTDTFELGSPVHDLIFSTDGKNLACADESGEIIVEQLAYGKEFRYWTGAGITSLAISKEGSVLASGDLQGNIFIYTIRKNNRGVLDLKQVATIQGHNQAVTSLAFHPNGKILASGSADSTIRQINLQISLFDLYSALDLPVFATDYRDSAQEEIRTQIYNASYFNLPYTLVGQTLNINDAVAVAITNAQYFRGKAPFLAYSWQGTIQPDLKEGPKRWMGITRVGTSVLDGLGFDEMARDSVWLYLYDPINYLHIRLSLQSGVMQVRFGQNWTELPLSSNVQGNIFHFSSGSFEPSSAGHWKAFARTGEPGLDFQVGDSPDPDWTVLNSVDHTFPVQLRIPKRGGGLTYSDGQTTGRLPICMIPWNQIETTKVLPYFGRQVIYSEVKLNGKNNVLEVEPGASINLSFNWKIDSIAADAYCPGCIVQIYYGIKDNFSRCLVSEGMAADYFQGLSDQVTYTFQAPFVPGVYYITQRGSLDYYCNEKPEAHSNDRGEAIAVIRVLPPGEK